MAFGTGAHETTQLIISNMINHINPGYRVLDLGAGSGILGITALKFKAQEVIAVEYDQDCKNIVHAYRVYDYSDREDWNLFWLIDPLDGTKEFIKRNGEFTVNIALISNNKPILGVVYAPVLDITWYGVINEGSFKLSKNSKTRITVIKPNDIMKVVTSRSHANNPKLDTFLEDYPNHELVKMGSSMKICLVADGSAHIYPRLGPTMEWDTAAAHAVVKYAGGNIYDLNNNKELEYNKFSLLNPEFLVNHI